MRLFWYAVFILAILVIRYIIGFSRNETLDEFTESFLTIFIAAILTASFIGVFIGWY